MRLLPPAVTALVLISAAGCATRTRAPEPQGPLPEGFARPAPSPASQVPAQAQAQAPEAAHDDEVSLAPRRSNRPSPKHDPRYALPRGDERSLTIYLGSQTFEYVEDGQVISSGEVSSGSTEHPTPTGSFRVEGKERNKRSGKYTNYFDQNTPMPYSLQFHGPYFIHEGWIPGYADSHGCVRLHYEDARFLFDRMRIGDAVLVKSKGRARPASVWGDIFPVF